MARRRLAEEPLSRFAAWSRRLALFSLAVVLLAIVIARADLLDTLPVLATLGAGLALAVLGILAAFVAFGVIWQSGARGFGHAVTGLAIGAALIAYPSYLGWKATKLPMIADITTDAIDPPRFEVVARLRSRQANPVLYAGLYAAEQQRGAYPDIEPLMVAVTPEAAYEATMALVTKRKWRVINARQPQAGRRDGYIEAVAVTPIMAFRDDVAIRIRPVGAGTRIDMRSASRYGRLDFGVNAARIRSLLEDIDDLTSVVKPERPPPKPAAPQKGGQSARR
ncbi:DUF1499 domain-containing protein [Rhodoplanes sp. TEM]|uniref:DUF1499 domain-containing protein n=1 Tax=Rhodoplanes tepidamans TaxID=200616 RepID=A0ABT5JJC3_RHOTP|nr:MULTISPECIES: DUF1499 domain-containing protein [Rhodoplanes]MDC7789701.1 DUF1499 domain-containing protein [Rhodoplanes tepidamans]MDC7984380.1 DUF1499 domain-containing protein [Rhodoplanes sp. TEM]MDQ0358350.1 uncharacterized protein (DUF1499 family) [Rhodoplanes tepidamans]